MDVSSQVVCSAETSGTKAHLAGVFLHRSAMVPCLAYPGRAACVSGKATKRSASLMNNMRHQVDVQLSA